MNDIHINRLDLNLLRVFDVLLEERNATRAGARLGLSQSAVSHALGRLRHALGDDLFVRESQGLRPTQRAVEIGAQVHSALAQLQSALAAHDFEPLQTERRFTLMSGSYTCAVFAPALAARMALEAPRATLSIAEFTPDLLDRLDSREIDFAVGGGAIGPARLSQEVLLRETLVWVVRRENPFVPEGPINLEQLIAVPHLVIARSRAEATSGLTMRTNWEDASGLEPMLRELGIERRIGVVAPDTYAAISILRQSDMAALIPRRMALATSQFGMLRVLEPPTSPPEVQMNLHYLGERMADPAMVWMRDLIRRVAAGI